MRNYLDQFAIEGLRTLVLAQKKIDQKEFDAFKQKYEAAKNLIDKKQEKMEELQAQLETMLTVIGATAIEDKLQDQVRKIFLL